MWSKGTKNSRYRLYKAVLIFFLPYWNIQISQGGNLKDSEKDARHLVRDKNTILFVENEFTVELRVI